jgi:dihydroxy-acid dehydratase
MDAKRDLKAKLPSRHVTEGPERAPHRSYYYAMGLTREQIHQPFVGVATCWNEAAPCNISLMRQAQAVKKGVAAAGGTPREFCTITVTDGIAMGHEGMKSSLPSREVIADSVELTMRGHAVRITVWKTSASRSRRTVWPNRGAGGLESYLSVNVLAVLPKRNRINDWLTRKATLGYS